MIIRVDNLDLLQIFPIIVYREISEKYLSLEIYHVQNYHQNRRVNKSLVSNLRGTYLCVFRSRVQQHHTSL